MLASVLDYMHYACLRTSEQVCRSTSDHTTTAAHCWVLAADTDQYMPPASKPWQTSCSRCCLLLTQQSSLHQTGNNLREDPTTRGPGRPNHTRPGKTQPHAAQEPFTPIWDHWTPVFLHMEGSLLRTLAFDCDIATLKKSMLWRDQRGRQTDGQCGHTDAYC